MNLAKIRKKLLKIRSLLRLSPKKSKMFKVLFYISLLFLFLAFFSTKIEQLRPAFLLLYSLSSIPLTFAFLLFVPKKALIRHDTPGFNYKRLAIGTISLLCLDVGALIAFLGFTGVSISLGLNVGFALFLLMTISGPIFEELIFRLGIIGGLSWSFKWFAKRAGVRWRERSAVEVLCIVASAVTFGLAHMYDVIKRTPQATMLITFGGAVYGFAYVKYGLASSILLHAAHNIVVLIL